MSKTRKQSRGSKRGGSHGSGLGYTLGRAEQCLRMKQWDEAADLLEPLTERYPNNSDVWAMLGEAYNQLGDAYGLWDVSQNLLRLEPQEPDNWYNAVGVSLLNMMPFTAKYFADEFLRQFPTDTHAQDIREQRVNLEKACSEIKTKDTTEQGATDQDFREIEQSHIAVSHGDFALGEQLSRKITERSPHLIAPLNNLSLAYAVQGRFEEAVATARQVLERQPNNIHAQANLAQLLYRSGRRAEAEAVAEQLSRQTVTGDHLAKQLEGLSYLGKDAEIIRLFEAAETQTEQTREEMEYGPLLYHLAAVAYARQGNDKRAKQLWQKAIKADPAFVLAQDNLDNLKRDVGERSPAFPFSFYQWIPVQWIEGLVQAVEKGVRSEAALKQAMDKLLRETPGLETILPVLWERGDENGRQFALQTAWAAQLPLLRDFALSESGTDQDRMQAAQQAIERGFLPRGKPLSLFMKGKRQELMMLDYEITSEPQPSRAPKSARKKLLDAHEALLQRDYVKAETLAREALILAPNESTLFNYLASALQGQGRQEEMKAVIQQMVDRFPDYLFGQVALARLLVEQEKTEEAQSLLDPLLSRGKFHISEFSALCAIQIELLIARKEYEGAKSWMQMWQQADPDNPNLGHFRRLLRGK